MSDINLFELAIIAIIIAGIALAILRAGQANPESTGQLGKNMGKLDSDVKSLKGDVSALARKVQKMEEDGATTKDIDSLRQLIEAKMQLLEQTQRGVQRIETFLTEKGLGGR